MTAPSEWSSTPPTLFEICVQVVGANLDLVESLQGVSEGCGKAILKQVVSQRFLEEERLGLFSLTSVDLSGCRVTDNGLTRISKACGGKLRQLELAG